ncbi:MAG: outer membrane protein assembly factor BamD [Planctomycetes bacterium]|nr:outer membrane protein assembly factor BamD [Planctomycetota bacterium]
MKYFLLFTLYFLLLVAGCAGQPIEPPKDVPPSPAIENKYTEAQQFYTDSKFDRALAILEDCAETVKNFDQKERITFLQAECLFQMRYNEKAHKIYTTFLSEFAKSERFDDAVARELEIGFRFVKGEKRSLWGLYIIPAYDYGMKIIKDTIGKYPYAKPSEPYHLKLADHLFKDEYYDLALTEYEGFIKTYPKSESLPHCEYQVARSHLKEYQGSSYEIEPLLAAKKSIDEFLKKYENIPLRADGEKLHKEITEQLAQRDYEVGYYYYKTGKHKSARIYFESVIADYPETSWAKKSAELSKELKN